MLCGNTVLEAMSIQTDPAHLQYGITSSAVLCRFSMRAILPSAPPLSFPCRDACGAWLCSFLKPYEPAAIRAAWKPVHGVFFYSGRSTHTHIMEGRYHAGGVLSHVRPQPWCLMNILAQHHYKYLFEPITASQFSFGYPRQDSMLPFV